jgi:hypothetical protein
MVNKVSGLSRIAQIIRSYNGQGARTFPPRAALLELSPTEREKLMSNEPTATIVLKAPDPAPGNVGTTGLVRFLSQPGRNGTFVPLSAYHGDRSAVSTSSLKAMLLSPAHYQSYLSGKCKRDTSTLFMNQAVHDILLLPKYFKERYVVSPYTDSRSHESRNFRLVNSNKKILTPEQAASLNAISESVQRHTFASGLLKSDIKERSFVFQDKETGLWVKFRPDCLDMADGICIDIKKTRNASANGFVLASVEYDYDLQVAVYLTGLRDIYQRDFDFGFLAVEETDPYNCALYAVSQEMLQTGLRKMRRALDLVKKCQDEGVWPGYQPDGGYEVIPWPCQEQRSAI